MSVLLLKILISPLPICDMCVLTCNSVVGYNSTPSYDDRSTPRYGSSGGRTPGARTPGGGGGSRTPGDRRGEFSLVY